MAVMTFENRWTLGMESHSEDFEIMTQTSSTDSLGLGALGIASPCSSRSTAPSDSSSYCRSRCKSGISQLFIVEKSASLPSGCFAKAVCRSSGRNCAIRAFGNTHASAYERVSKEVAISKGFNFVHIHKLYEIIQDGKNAYLVAERFESRLADVLVGSGRIAEANVATVMCQLLRAVEHMHMRGVCHRDISLDNLLLKTDAPISENVLKLTGFDFACNFSPREPLKGEVGAPSYRAPEIYSGMHSNMVDLWSSGVVMFQCLCGYLPFEGSCEPDLRRKVQRGRLVFNAADWNSISEDSQSLLRRLLVTTPCFRPTATDALEHTWITKCEANTPCLQQSVSEVCPQQNMLPIREVIPEVRGDSRCAASRGRPPQTELVAQKIGTVQDADGHVTEFADGPVPSLNASSQGVSCAHLELNDVIPPIMNSSCRVTLMSARG